MKFAISAGFCLAAVATIIGQVILAESTLDQKKAVAVTLVKSIDTPVENIEAVENKADFRGISLSADLDNPYVLYRSKRHAKGKGKGKGRSRKRRGKTVSRSRRRRCKGSRCRQVVAPAPVPTVQSQPVQDTEAQSSSTGRRRKHKEKKKGKHRLYDDDDDDDDEGRKGGRKGKKSKHKHKSKDKSKSKGKNDQSPVLPPSGQLAKLGGSTKPIEGYIEVNKNGKWGLLCATGWDIRDANVLCRQLGFSRGAYTVNVKGKFGHGSYSTDDIVMIGLNCQGNESRIQDCHYQGSTACSLDNTASVHCRPNIGCDSGWIAGNGLCYKPHGQYLNFEDANQKCQQMNAHLVTMENQAESDFISNWLLTGSSKWKWWTGGRKVLEDGALVWKWIGTLYSVQHFNKWFPGWTSSTTKSKHKSKHKSKFKYSRRRGSYASDTCMMMSSRFRYGKSLRKVGYFFWDEVSCDRRLPFICEKVATIPGECYRGTGTSYNGKVFRTERGTLCQKWSDSSKINPTTHPDKGLGSHNYCRNPDGDTRPWCWVDTEKNSFGYCALSQCGVTTPAPVPTTPPLAPGQCNTGQFLCNITKECISKSLLCNGYKDCSNGEDERGCAPPTKEYRKSPGKEMTLPKNLTGIGKPGKPINPYSMAVAYSNVKPNDCASLCLRARGFVCRSFNYRKDHEECTLYQFNTATFPGVLMASVYFEYYELRSQAEPCTGATRFRCRNLKCIDKELKCNGYDDCNDFSDEENCTLKPKFELRLADGRTEHEGRVEVRHMGEWGIVCDDHWNMKAAKVVCRQLGYKGAVKAFKNSEFGSGNGNFLMDEVRCRGTEKSLDKCRRAPWREHDCKDYEAAGVQCIVGKVCQNDEFVCANKMCIPLTDVCDKTDNCGDKSDERNCELKVELKGGRNNKEGRVELIRNGVRGTVCDDQWDDKDAQVICRMLGFNGPAEALTNGSFGPGNGIMWTDNVQCKGYEKSLEKCTKAKWGDANCKHTEDAGVRCDVVVTTTPRPPTTTTPIPTTPKPRIQCGQRLIRQPRPRIVGGFKARYGAFPWQVGIQRSDGDGGYGHWCGGTLLNEFWILSAAHCYEQRPKEDFRVRVGDGDNTVREQFEEEFLVEELIKHENYDRDSHDYDVALLKVRRKRNKGIQFNNHTQPACLPHINQPYPGGKTCLISGWGTTGAAYPKDLRAVEIPIIAESTCTALYKYSLTDRMFCAGYLEGNVDACQGDSGGPMVCNLSGKHTVMGVTSWGYGCAQPNAPGVYVRVTKFVDWIKDKMNKIKN